LAVLSRSHTVSRFSPDWGQLANCRQLRIFSNKLPDAPNDQDELAKSHMQNAGDVKGV
jgi:hypothetical protein